MGRVAFSCSTLSPKAAHSCSNTSEQMCIHIVCAEEELSRSPYALDQKSPEMQIQL